MFVYSRLLRNRFEDSLKSSFGEFVKNTPTCSYSSHIMIAGFISAITTSNQQVHTHNFMMPEKQKQLLVTPGTQTKHYMIEADNQMKAKVIETASQCEIGITTFGIHTETYTNDLDTQTQIVASEPTVQVKTATRKTVIETNTDQQEALFDTLNKGSTCEIGNQINMSGCDQCQSTKSNNKELQVSLQQALIDLKQKERAYRELEKLYQRKNGMLTTITKQYKDLKHQHQQPQQRLRRQQGQHKNTGRQPHYEL